MTAIAPTAPRRFATVNGTRPQDCGPRGHFERQALAGSLQEFWRCERCGKVNQPYSPQEITLMRRNLDRIAA